jgi:hypothetical protein
MAKFERIPKFKGLYNPNVPEKRVKVRVPHSARHTLAATRANRTFSKHAGQRHTAKRPQGATLR